MGLGPWCKRRSWHPGQDCIGRQRIGSSFKRESMRFNICKKTYYGLKHNKDESYTYFLSFIRAVAQILSNNRNSIYRKSVCFRRGSSLRFRDATQRLLSSVKPKSSTTNNCFNRFTWVINNTFTSLWFSHLLKYDI